MDTGDGSPVILFDVFIDRKFCVKARLYQALGVSLNLLRHYNAHPRILLPITHVLKLYSADGQSTY